MSQITDFPARGRVTAVADGKVTFQPIGTSYEFHLGVPKNFSVPVGSLVEGLIKVSARKLYTVPSGGNFVQPIFGPPRIIQGRVKYADPKHLVVHAGAPIVVDLPADDNALDLHQGGIGVGKLVNAVAWPGARFELMQSAWSVH